MQKSILKPVLTIIFVFGVVALFVYFINTTKRSEPIVFTQSDYDSSLYKDMESSVVAYLETKGPEDKDFLGAETYTCAVDLKGYQGSFIYALTTCQGFSKSDDDSASCVMQQGTGMGEIPMRFNYKSIGSKIFINNNSPFLAVGPGEDSVSDAKYHQLFPGSWYQKLLEGPNVGDNPNSSVFTLKSRAAEKFEKVYGCEQVDPYQPYSMQNEFMLNISKYSEVWSKLGVAEFVTCDSFEGNLETIFPSLNFKKKISNIEQIYPNIDPEDVDGSRTYCELKATSKGTNYSFLADDLRKYFNENNWIASKFLDGDGPSETAFAYQFGSSIALVHVGWANYMDLCPSNEPIGYCEITDKSKIENEIKVQLWK